MRNFQNFSLDIYVIKIEHAESFIPIEKYEKFPQLSCMKNSAI